jgi:two-component system LytT family sensor kinase
LFGGRRFLVAQAGIWVSYGIVSCLAALPGQGWEGVRGLLLFKGVLRPLTGLAVSSLLALGFRVRRIHTRSATWIVPFVLLASTLGGIAWFLAARAILFLTLPPGTGFWVGDKLFHFSLEYIFVLLAWTSALLWIDAGARARQSLQDASSALAARRAAELEALAYQLNPHLLFNTLASLRGLIRRAPERAEQMASELAGFLRHTLTNPPRGENTLGTELEIVRAFLEIERLRFERGIELVMSIPADAASRMVPALILNPLVENAVKYADSDGGPLRVEIAASLKDEVLSIVVGNRGNLGKTGNGPAVDGDRPKLGLHNVRERLALCYPGKARLEVTEASGWVRVQVVIEGDRIP